jgi:hypothetical protein
MYEIINGPDRFDLMVALLLLRAENGQLPKVTFIVNDDDESVLEYEMVIETIQFTPRKPWCITGKAGRRKEEKTPAKVDYNIISKTGSLTFFD